MRKSRRDPVPLFAEWVTGSCTDEPHEYADGICARSVTPVPCGYCGGQTKNGQCVACGMACAALAADVQPFDPSAIGRALAAGVLQRMANEHIEGHELVAALLDGRTGDTWTLEELRAGSDLVEGDPDAWERRGWKAPPSSWHWVYPVGLAMQWCRAQSLGVRASRQFAEIQRATGDDFDECEACGIYRAITITGKAGAMRICGDCREDSANEILEKLKRELGAARAWSSRYKRAAKAYRYRLGRVSKWIESQQSRPETVRALEQAFANGQSWELGKQQVKEGQVELCGSRHASGLTCETPLDECVPNYDPPSSLARRSMDPVGKRQGALGYVGR
jgi:hypothetical protein